MAELAVQWAALLSSQDAYAPVGDYVAATQRAGMTPGWRNRLGAWMLEYTLSLDVPRDTVGVALSLVDRFLSAESADARTVKLAGLAALLTAAKLAGCGTLTVGELEENSQGQLSVAAIREMELALCAAVQWRLQAPTPHALAHNLVARFLSADADQQAAVLGAAFELADFAVVDYSMLRFRPSDAAVAAVSCAVARHCGAAAVPYFRAAAAAEGVELSAAADEAARAMRAARPHCCGEPAPAFSLSLDVLATPTSSSKSAAPRVDSPTSVQVAAFTPAHAAAVFAAATGAAAASAAGAAAADEEDPFDDLSCVEQLDAVNASPPALLDAPAAASAPKRGLAMPVPAAAAKRARF